jgi:hypothetical protein
MYLQAQYAIFGGWIFILWAFYPLNVHGTESTNGQTNRRKSHTILVVCTRKNNSTGFMHNEHLRRAKMVET